MTWPAPLLPWSVAAVAAALLSFEVALTRIYAFTQWSYLAYMVISLALLGFGASGTALVLLRRQALRAPRSVFIGCALACALS
ncbi:MAG: hypothetical protein HY335_07155, partial [Deinococcus sp.]|nr:hypothetical protein [Deinococcus sp.]